MNDKLDIVLEEIFPWYKEAGTEYVVDKHISCLGTYVAEVFKCNRMRYLLQIFETGGIALTSYFPSVDFDCVGRPFIVYAARRRIIVKDCSPESMQKVKQLADGEDLCHSVEQEVTEWVDAIHAEIDKCLPIDAVSC